MKTGKKQFSELLIKEFNKNNLKSGEIKKIFSKVTQGNDESNYVPSILNGSAPGGIKFLMGIYAALQGKEFGLDSNFKTNKGLEFGQQGFEEAVQRECIETNNYELQKALVFWLQAVFEQTFETKPNLIFDESYSTKWNEAIEDLKGKFGLKPLNSTLPTLDHFPHHFTPLTVIAGTGQADPPMKITDLFRSQANLTDLFFLNELKLPSSTRIVSDRFVLNMSPQDRIKHFGECHLLLIGGPKVNAITRRFARHSFFRFQFEPNERKFQNFYDDLMAEDEEEALFRESDCVNMLYELLTKPKILLDELDFKDLVDDPVQREKIHKKSINIIKKLGSPEDYTYQDIIKLFDPTHLVDPIKRRFVAAEPGSNKDYTLITIAPNFYNRDLGDTSFNSYKNEKVSVIVAGLDKVGTCSGVKRLARPESFVLHPLGGFLEAKEANPSLEFEKYNNCRCAWKQHLTPEYSIESLIERINDFNNGHENEALQSMAVEDKKLENYLKFLKMFQT